MDPTERIERATQFAGAKVKQVNSSDLAKPTPCSDFDVRALLNHMIGGLGMLTTAAQGSKATIPEGDQFGEDPGKTYEERRQALLTALREPGVFDRTWQMPFGDLDGHMMGAIAFMEHLTHGWDVARSTGQDAAMPTELVSECLDVVSPMDAMLRMPGVCGPAVAVADDAPIQDRLVAFMGRQP